jgi:hypothetical protein
MNRIITYLVIATLLAVLLAACASDTNQQGETVPGEAVPGMTEPLPGFTEPVPGASDPLTPPDEPQSGYPPAEGTAGDATPAGETTPAEVMPTTPVEATSEVSEPGVIPPTGPLDPGRVSNLFRSPVTSQDGEEIGLIDDFVANLETGTLAYVVVAVNGEEGAEKTLVPIPIVLLSWDASNGLLQLAVDRQTVLDAPSLEGGEYPNTQESGWDAEFQAYWESITPGS